MHPRGELRVALRAALAAHPRFAQFREQRAWSRDVSAEALPMYLVATPRETSRHASGKSVDRTTDIAVAIRRMGGDDLEDLLDDDSATVEALLLPILAEKAGQTYGLDMTEIAVTAEGQLRIGKLDMVFRQVRYTPEGAPA